MLGIRSWGAYVPVFRLERSEIARAMGPFSIGGERSVANFDEDTITMSVEAVRNAVDGIDSREIDALFFASTSAPYKEKQSASSVALAADLKEDILTSDFSGSIRAGVSALSLAIDRVKSGSSKNVVVAASDCRLGAGGSEHEQAFGDGAASMVIGDKNVAAAFEGSYSINDDFIDVWRTSEEIFVRSWEDRFIKTEGYKKNVIEVVRGILDKYKLAASDFQKVVIPAPDLRSLKEVAESLGFDVKTQVQESFLNTIGNTGTAHPLLMLSASLDKAKLNDRILFVGYGDGAQAFIFSVKDKIREGQGSSVENCVTSKMPLASYEQYLKFRKLIMTEAARSPAYPSSLPYMWRERDYFTRFHGSKCLNCGTEQYPRHRVCYECKSKDSFEEINLAPKKGVVITYTRDYLFPSPVPPHVTAVVELEGGCRVYVMMTDVNPDEMKSQMLVGLVFRMLHSRAGFYHYGWKARPIKMRG